MAHNTTKRRNILITAIIIVVLVVSSVTAVIIYNQLATTRISLSLSTNQTSTLQGSSSQIQVNVESKGHPEKTTLTASLNSSSIQCSFSPATGKSSFNSTLMINVPDSTPTANYSLTVIASGDGAMANASCIISVPSQNVTVSGTISIALEAPFISIDSLQFQGIQTKAVYAATLSQTGNENESDYSVILKNQDVYNVIVSFRYALTSIPPPSFASGNVGNVTVYVPVGNSTITGLNFTYNQPITVSGEVYSGLMFPSSLISIKFTDVRTGSETYFVFSNNYPPVTGIIGGKSASGNYSVVLINEHTYSVTIYYYIGPSSQNVLSNTESVGSFTVVAPAGETAISNGFAY
jgi:hypothetical protein